MPIVKIIEDLVRQFEKYNNVRLIFKRVAIFLGVLSLIYFTSILL